MLHLADTLANPVWQALNTVQQHMNAGTEQLAYYAADIAPFAGMNNWDETSIRFFEHSLPSGRRFSLMQEENVALPASLQLHFSVPLYQMVCVAFQPSFQHHILQPLTEAHVPQMLELTSLTKPGPFFTHTLQFGGYIGVFDGERLVAMGGERLKVPGFTEVSAICTHPQYRAQQMAKHILSALCQRILQRGEIPFLHSLTTNESALNVYQQLGFRPNRTIFYAMLEKPQV